MIEHVDATLRQVLLDGVPALRPAEDTAATVDQVRFQVPDQAWEDERQNITVDSTPVNALNVFLLDLREARALRSNQRVVARRNGVSVSEPAPFRVDCHYLVTAWSPVEQTPPFEPTLDEHKLLAQVLAALAQHCPLKPRQVLRTADLANLPPELRDEALPMQVAPADGFPQLGELWAAMGRGGRWRPGAYVIVTVPLALEASVLGPPVTAVIADTSVEDGAPERLVVIGGTALDVRGGGAVGLPGADVVLESAAGSVLRTIADAQGRFTFGALTPGAYTLRGHAAGLAQAEASIAVPSPSGSHDLRFS
jgi:hypothetical protein